jgi:type I restriction enzyme M protein
VNGAALVQKLWNYGSILRDDGAVVWRLPRIGGGRDRLEQLTFLLFLKMANEQSKPSFNKPSLPVPVEFAWPTLLKPEG